MNFVYVTFHLYSNSSHGYRIILDPIIIIIIESLKIFTKSLQEEGIYAYYVFVLNIINELDIGGDFLNTYITNLIVYDLSICVHVVR